MTDMLIGAALLWIVQFLAGVCGQALDSTGDLSAIPRWYEVLWVVLFCPLAGGMVAMSWLQSLYRRRLR